MGMAYYSILGRGFLRTKIQIQKLSSHQSTTYRKYQIFIKSNKQYSSIQHKHIHVSQKPIPPFLKQVRYYKRIGEGSGSGFEVEVDEKKDSTLTSSGSGSPIEIENEDDGCNNTDDENTSEIEEEYLTANEPYILSPDEIKEISGGDPEVEKKIQFILMEHELLRQEGHRVPSSVKMKHWAELLMLQSKNQRMKFYSFLWKTEMKQLSNERKKETLRRQRQEEFDKLPRLSIEEDPYWMTYGLNRNAIFLRLYDSKIITFHSHRIISEMVLGTPLILDCGYDDQMVFREAKNCANQLEFLITDNRQHPQPFNIVFTNANPKSNLMTQLVKRIPTLYDDSYALDIRECSYLDIYPKEKLVYLSPHARDELIEFNEDEIYIIGAIVDKSDPRPFSLAKAKKEGIRIKKLPLDSELDWGLGNKSLTINQIVNIMLEIRNTGDWKKAFRFIPRRKLIGGRMDPNNKKSNVLMDYEEIISCKKRGFQKSNDNSFDKYSRKSTGYNNNNNNRRVGVGGTKDIKTIMSDY